MSRLNPGKARAQLARDPGPTRRVAFHVVPAYDLGRFAEDQLAVKLTAGQRHMLHAMGGAVVDGKITFPTFTLGPHQRSAQSHYTLTEAGDIIPNYQGPQGLHWHTF